MLSLEAHPTLAGALNADAIAATVGHLALVHADSALPAFPPGRTTTTALQVLTMAAAKDRTNIWKKKGLGKHLLKTQPL